MSTFAPRPLRLLALAAAWLFLGLAIGSMAQERAPAHMFEISIGAGALFAPSYLGDDAFQLSALPAIRVVSRDIAVASVEDGLRINAIRAGGWRAGPLAQYGFGRDEDGEGVFKVAGDDTDDLLGLGDIDGAPELGGFVSYDIGRFNAQGAVRQAIGGHRGLIGEVSVRYQERLDRFGPPVFVSVGPEARFVSEDYMQSYFGVDAGQSARSGLSAYDADGGLLSVGLAASATVPLSRRVALTATARYDRLGDEAAESSLVEERGSPDQASAGLFLSYRFGLF